MRLTCDPASKAYLERRTAEGKSRREIVRCLKRYVAREIFRLLVVPEAVPDGADLRTARIARGLSQTPVATALNTSINAISRLERSLTFDTDLARRYESFLASISDDGSLAVPAAA